MTAAGDVVRDRILDVIESFPRDNGYSPTVRQIAEQVRLSKSAVYKHLTRLREAGIIESPRPGAGWMLTP